MSAISKIANSIPALPADFRKSNIWEATAVSTHPSNDFFSYVVDLKRDWCIGLSEFPNSSRTEIKVPLSVMKPHLTSHSTSWRLPRSSYCIRRKIPLPNPPPRTKPARYRNLPPRIHFSDCNWLWRDQSRGAKPRPPVLHPARATLPIPRR